MPVADGWTIAEAVHHLDPPISRRDLARLLADVTPAGSVHGRLGRRAKVYPVAAILEVHAAWVRSRFLGRAEENPGP